MRLQKARSLLLGLAALIAATKLAAAGDEPHASIRGTVDGVIRPMMAKDGIPGAAVAVIADGSVSLFNYGVASKETHQPVTRNTLFEIGSVTKTFTATLASWAQVDGRLEWSDEIANHVPSLRESPFGKVSLLALATHTPGGIPLQVPGEITTDDQLMQYLEKWRPAYPPGTRRTYSNVGIGMLGLAVARSWGEPFTALMEQRLFPALGMKNSFVDLPAAKMRDYAQGYSEAGAPVRMSPGMLWSQTYGVRSTATDLARFIEANMGVIQLDGRLQRAITQTHTGYFEAGPMTQDLVWEQYPYPVGLAALLSGNSARMIFEPNPVEAITPPQEPQGDTWINKTGSTNGFGAYVAFVPAKRLGIVVLANKSFPIADRVTAAYRVLTTLAKEN
ncbi:MAG: beta-lactamase [Candidatus Eremiobacteraeota bacterium]|nr:beta-lactamase [Candidatus Eremiobacteraeota bacterium]